MQNIVYAVQNRSQKHPHHKAILYLEDGHDKTAELSFGELDTQAKIVAAHLQAQHMSGNRVLLLYPAGIEFIISLLGCWYAGAIAVPVPCPKPGEFAKQALFLNAIADDSECKAILCLNESCSDIRAILKRKVSILATDVLKSQLIEHFQPLSITDNTIAYLQYTSGSTSAPKAAIITHGNLQHSLQESIKAWHYTRKSVTMTWAPHTHVYGLVCGILLPVYHGTLAIIMSPATFINKPLTWLATISRYKVTHSGCPNFGYDLCTREIPEEALASLNLKHWQVAINGGDIVQYQTLTGFVEKFKRCGFELKQFCSAYGMSELSGAIALSSFGTEPNTLLAQKESHRRLVSSGKLLGGLQAVAVNPETRLPLNDGETGEIWLSGKSLAQGYWRRLEETQQAFHASLADQDHYYFRTGDLGFIVDNEIYLTGRLKEVLVIYGKKYYPLDLETSVAKALSQYPITLTQVAFSTEIAGQEKIIMVQELPANSPESLWPELKDKIRHTITKNHGVEIHEVILSPEGTIPKTASGKLQRKKAQLLFLQQNLAVLVPDLSKETKSNDKASRDKPIEFINLIARVLNIEAQKIDMDAPLSRYSFDSINIIQLTSELNECYQLSLSPAALYEYATLGEFYTELSTLAPGLRGQAAERREFDIQEPTSRAPEPTSRDLFAGSSSDPCLGIPGTNPARELVESKTNDIAIIGMSGIFPCATDVTTFWNNLCEGKDCISELPLSRTNWGNLSIKWGGFIDHADQFDAAFFNISPREAELIDPQQRLFLQTIWKTIEDAGYPAQTLATLKTGLFVGVFNHDYAELLQKNEVMDPYLTTGTMNSMIANRISYILNLRGPSETIDTACSSSLVAIHQAVHAILQGDCDLALAGGVNILSSPTSFIAAHQAGMLSEEGRCKTFDKNANGYVRGEGAAAILLKTLSKAMDDGDHIYGIIKGTAVNHGGHVNTLTAPNPNAQAEVIIAACHRAKIAVDSIQYIETHGTGTPLGDPIEINGLKKAFQHLALEQGNETLARHFCGLGAVKTHIGHLESAAGIAGIIKTLLAMQHELIPANLNLTELNPYLEIEDSPFYLVDKPMHWPKIANKPRRAGVSSFGFGGTNAHVILEESPERTPAPSIEAPYLICLSAMTHSALQQRIADLLTWLDKPTSLPNLAALSYTLNTGRQHFTARFCVMVHSVAELKESLKTIFYQEEFSQHLLEHSANFESDHSELNTIRRNYLQGQSINWMALYGEYQEKISLPTYPFAKESHWLEIKNKAPLGLHALIDANNSTFSSTAFSKRFSINEFYLRDHQVNEESVLPGAVGLEMIRAAASLALNTQHQTSLSNITWKNPIKDRDWSNPLYVHLIPEANYATFAITESEEFISYMTGEIHLDELTAAPLPSILNLHELKSSLYHNQEPSDIYAYFAKIGIHYGSGFQVIHSLDFNESHLLAQLVLPASLAQESFVLHPALLDGVLQTTQALLKNRETLYLPFSIKQLDIYQALTSTCQVYANRVSAVDELHMPVFNIQVTDTEGRILLVITEFSLCAVSEMERPKAKVAYYAPKWNLQALAASTRKPPNSLLILGTDKNRLHSLANQFVEHTSSYQLLEAPYQVNLSLNSIPECIIIALDERSSEWLLPADCQKNLNQSYYLLHSLVSQISQLRPKHSVRIICTSTNSSPYSRALIGFAKSVHQEQSNVSCRFIELDDLGLLVNELTQNELEVRYDQKNHRYVRGYDSLPPINSNLPILKKSGVYLITGGMGELGYLFASYLAEHYQAQIVLTGRTAKTEQHQQKIEALEKKGALVTYLAADISSLNEVDELIKQIKARFGAIHGIIHAAGLTRDGLIINKDLREIAQVLAPKIQGTLNLHMLTQTEPLDLLVLFSSVAAVFGNAGQSDYAYANAFLDEFATAREQQRALGHCFGQTVSINWPLWEDSGLQIASEYQQLLEQSLGIVSLPKEQGWIAFLQAIQATQVNCIVLSGYQHKLTKALHDHSMLNPAKENTGSFKNNDNLQKQTAEYLRKILAETLKYPPERIEWDLPFETYGIDSLMIVQLNQRFADEWSGLPKTLFFEYHNLAALTAYFLEHHANGLMQRLANAHEGGMDKNAYLQDKTRMIAAKTLRTSINDESSPDIAIIGINGRYPEADNLTEFWQNLSSGKDCIREIPKERWDWASFFDADPNNAGKTYSKWGGFLNDVDRFDPLFFNISPREAALMDPQERLFLETAWNTIEDAGYARDQLAGKKVGVYVGVMYGQYQLFDKQPHDALSFIPTNSIFASIANRVSYFFDFHGPSIALDTMCSSSLTAIHLACQSLQKNECDLALAGGVNLTLHPNKYLLLSQGKFLASDGHCRSFGEGGDGYVPGEAVGAVLLKPLAKALTDGDLIYAVIKGSQIGHGGKTNGYTVPNPNAQAELLAHTYQKAKVDPRQVTYIEAHGTGTSLGDPIEIAALNKVFQHKHMPRQCALGSVKSNIGHCESAAGIAALTKVVLQLQNQTLVPSLLAETLNPNIDWSSTSFQVQQSLSEWQPSSPDTARIAGISSFGAGGSNAHLIISEAPEALISPTKAKSHYLLTLSAKTELALNQRLSDLHIWLEKNPLASLDEISYTLNACRTHFDHRCVVLVSTIKEAKELIQQLAAHSYPKPFLIHEDQKDLASTQHKEILEGLASRYIEGQNLDWQSIYAGETMKKISLPTYPFAKERYWYFNEESPPHEGFQHHPEGFQRHPERSEGAPKFPEMPRNVPQDTGFGELVTKLKAQVVQILKITQHQLSVEKNLGEYGMDSVHFIELAKWIAHQYQIEFTPAVFFMHSSLESIGQYLWDQFPEIINKTHSKNPLAPHLVNTHPYSSLPLPPNEHLLPATCSRDPEPFEPQKPVAKNHVPDRNQDIAIIGMQGLLPQSDDLASFWQHLLAGNDLVSEIPIERWNWRDYYGNEEHQSISKWGAFINNVDQFDAGFFNISAREANLMDPQQRLFLEIVWKTIEDAGYDPFALSSRNVGVFAGVEFSEYQNLIATQQKEHHGFIATGNSHSMITNRVSYFFNFHGPSEAIDTACSSSLVAIHRAVQAIRQGECDLAIAGGVSLILNPETMVVISQLGALSAEGRCKTFDKNANGYVKGEGVASLLLKPLKQAQADGDHIYGLIKASAVNHGGRAQSLTAPNAQAQSELLKRAYSQVDFSPDTLTYIETHGTGTALGDPVEIEGIKHAFKELMSDTNPLGSITLGSVKTNIGHLEPASGIAGVIKVILAMTHETIPGILHLNELNPYINLTDTPFVIAQQTKPWQRLNNKHGEVIPLRAGVSSFGFGGTNAHLILEEGVPHHPIREIKHEKPYYLIALSAKKQESLQQKMVELHQWMQQNKAPLSLASLSFTLNQGRAHFTYRCALVVDSIDTLFKALTQLINQENPDYCLINEGQTWVMQGPVFDEVYQTAVKALSEFNTRHLTDEALEQYRHKLFILADLYTKNYSIDWSVLYLGEKTQRIASLPVYPFSKQRYWHDQDAKPISSNKAMLPVTTPISSNLTDQTLAYLRQLFAEKLRTTAESIQVDETYEVYGVDSLIGLEITNRLEKDFGSLPKTLLYERNRLNDLAKFFIKNYKEQLSHLVSNQVNSALPALDVIEEIQAKTVLSPSANNTSGDIAIIGLSGTFPMANSMDELWDNLSAGRDCVSEVPADRWNYKDYPVSIGGKEHYFPHGGFIPDVDKFDPLFFNISPRDAGLMDPQERLFMQSVWSTLEDAGYTREKLKMQAQNSVGVFAGVTYNFYPLFIAEEWQKGNRVPLDIQSFSVANRISYFLDVNGPSFVVDTACSSSLAAIHLACESLLRGDCAMAIAGGVNLSLHPSKYHFLGSFNFMSEQGRCGSFAEGGTGYVPAEGVGSVLLKPLAEAIADNDMIYGIIKGSSMNHGGKTSGYTVPNPNAQAKVILQTLNKANIDPRTISYIEAHGTGTALGDPIEIRGLQDAFEQFTEDKQFCAIGSVKSNLGHLESAAGISQLAKVLLQMRHQKLVPSLHSDTLNPFIDFQDSAFYVQQTLSDWQPDKPGSRRAGVSSFGAGGANVHMIIEEYIPAKKPSARANHPYIFVLSALNEERLTARVQQMHAYLAQQKENEPELSDVCFSLQTGREAMTARLAIIVTNKEELLSALASYLSKGIPPVEHRETSPERGSVPYSDLIKQKNYTELVQHWINGAKVDWNLLYSNERPNLVSLPTYPFTKRRCWIPTKEAEPLAIVSSPSAELASINAQDWLYVTQWEKFAPANQPQTIQGKWLIFCERDMMPFLQEALGLQTAIYCHEQNIDEQQFIKSIHAAHGTDLRGLIYFCSDQNSSKEPLMDPSLSLLRLFKAMVLHTWTQQLTFCLASQSAQQVQASDSVNIWQHPLWSMTRIFAAEQAKYQALLLDLDATESKAQNAKILVKELELYQSQQNHIAYRKKERYSLRFLPYTLPDATPALQVPKVALVTGGLGALGYEVADYLVNQGTRFVLLTGTKERATLSEEKNTWLQNLEKKSKVRYACVDVADKKSMQQAILDAEKAWGYSIDGVFHLAGITTDNVHIANMDESLWANVLRVKIQGSLVLHELFLKAPLSCFILFSSIASVPHFGMAGLSAYAVANEFMNGLALYRRSLQLTASSINWVAWSEKGMSHRHNHDAFLAAVGMASLSINEGMALFDTLIRLDPAEITVCKINWKKFLQVNASAKQLDFFTHFIAEFALTNPDVAICSLNQEEISTLVLQCFASVLALESNEIDLETPFQNYGLDSISGISYTEQLGQHVPDVVAPMDLYRYPTINQLTDYILERVQIKEEPPAKPLNTSATAVDLDQLNEAQLNELLELELNELELAYE